MFLNVDVGRGGGVDLYPISMVLLNEENIVRLLVENKKRKKCDNQHIPNTVLMHLGPRRRRRYRGEKHRAPLWADTRERVLGKVLSHMGGLFVSFKFSPLAAER